MSYRSLENSLGRSIRKGSSAEYVEFAVPSLNDMNIIFQLSVMVSLECEYIEQGAIALSWRFVRYRRDEMNTNQPTSAYFTVSMGKVLITN